MRPVIPLLLLFLTLTAGGQTPFICRGDYFLVLTPNDASSLYQVDIEAATGRVVFSPLPAGGAGASLNAIGYRSTDNFIYGISNDNSDLYRIDASGRAEWLTAIPGLDRSFSYPAGDITPDGRYLVLLGNRGVGFAGRGGNSGILLFIDLATPGFPTRRVTPPANEVVCYDIAFDPTDGVLYGFDGNGSRLVVIDPVSGEIRTPFPPDLQGSTMGSLFFDAFGVLYGYGRPTDGRSQNTLFRIDKQTGALTVETTGPDAQRSDGCSCPFTVELTKRVTPRRAVACAPLTYTFEFANTSGGAQRDLVFEDVFPEGFTVTAVTGAPPGAVVHGVGAGALRIDNFSLPPGVSTLTVTATTRAGLSGEYRNQAVLRNLPGGLGTVILSDDPQTIVRDDPTPVFIEPLRVDLGETPASLCRGDTVVLRPEPALPGLSYRWSDGSSGAALAVSSGGRYAVTISSGCASVAAAIDIAEYAATAELPPTLDIRLGDSVVLNPVTGGTPPLRFAWTSSGAPTPCPDCPRPTVRPFFDTHYFLTVTDAQGCPARDSVLVRVDTRRYIFIPSAFSPNDDGRNDRFFVQSRTTETIRRFQVFSRWGELLFDRRQCLTNDPAAGWDGAHRGRPLNTGVFVYRAEIEFLDGKVGVYSGEVTLVR